MAFETPAVEEHFLRGRHGILLQNTSRLAACAVLPYLATFAKGASDWSELNIQEKLACFSALLGVVFGVLFAVLPTMGCYQRHMGPGRSELLIVAVLMYVLCDSMLGVSSLLQSLPETHTAGQLEGSRDTRAHDVDVGVFKCALGLGAVLTTSHLALPVRWSLVIWVDLLYLAAFTYLEYVAMREQDKVSDGYRYTCFVAMAMASNWGLRTAETKERLLFRTITDERTLRAQAEFSAVMSKDQQKSEGTRSGTRSVPSVYTEGSASLFREVGDQNEAALTELRALGEKEQWILGAQEVQLFEDRLLGKGGCGEVVAGSFCNNPVAIKRVAMKNGVISAADRLTVLNELRIMRNVRHPHIVLFFGALMPACNDVRLVLEQIQGVKLNSFVRRLETWRQASPHIGQQKVVLQGLCRALIYLHSRRPCIVHSDLKPDNIMVERRDGQPFPRLLDFGLSKKATVRARLTGGTVGYVAPELYRAEDRAPRPSADIFSLGVLLFFVSSGREAWSSYSREEMARMVRSNALPPVAWHPTTSLLEELKPVIERSMALAAASRPTSQEVHDELSPSSLSSRILAESPVPPVSVKTLTGRAAQHPPSLSTQASSTEPPMRTPLEPVVEWRHECSRDSSDDTPPEQQISPGTPKQDKGRHSARAPAPPEHQLHPSVSL